jgi:Ca-activated chloride channel family protein
LHATGARTGAATASCSGEVVLSVEVAPDVEAPVRSAAGEYEKTALEADGRCVTVRVAARAPHETARLLGGGWSDATAGDRPDVWIPDSTSWLELARLAEPARALLPEKGTTVATSPVVVAMPWPMASALGWPDMPLSWRDIVVHDGDADFWGEHGHKQWGPFRVVLANPGDSSSGADAMLSMVSAAVGLPVSGLTRDLLAENLLVKKVIFDVERRSAAVPASDEALLTELHHADADGHLQGYVSAAPMSESALFNYNRAVSASTGKIAAPENTLVATYPAGETVVHQVPFITLSAASGDPARAVAAEGFLHALLGDVGRAAFAAEGLRAPDGTNPNLTPDVGFPPVARPGPADVVGPEARDTALTVFGLLHRRGTSLAVFDTSGSMGQVVPGSGSRTRLDVAGDAAQVAVGLLAPDSNLGVWQTASDTAGGGDGTADHRELVPIGPMGGDFKGITRSVAVTGVIRSMRVTRGDSALYDTTLAAFRALTEAYTPGRPNQVVLLADGGNDDSSGISLDELVATLEREFDPGRPVHVVTIAYGNEAEAAALRRISAATGAKSYPALDSNSIFQVVIDALAPR